MSRRGKWGYTASGIGVFNENFLAHYAVSPNSPSLSTRPRSYTPSSRRLPLHPVDVFFRLFFSPGSMSSAQLVSSRTRGGCRLPSLRRPFL